jgi:hypothetical protein
MKNSPERREPEPEKKQNVRTHEEVEEKETSKSYFDNSSEIRLELSNIIILFD